MALINCKTCGKQVSDKAKTCPHCGAEIIITTVENPVLAKCEECGGDIPQGIAVCPHCGCPVSDICPQAEPKKKSKKGIIIGIVSAIVILVAAASVYLYFTQFSPDAIIRKKYDEAVSLYNEGNYDEALPIFEELGDYSNAIETAKGCKYNLGIEAMDSFDWETAVSYFTGLDYENSKKMLTDCSFLLDIEYSVNRRLEMTAKETSDRRTIVNTELAYLEKYRTTNFFDSSLKKLARQYLAGLDTQLASLDSEYYYEYQIEWQQGLVDRYDVLNQLYNKYDFMRDNKDFVAMYISQYDDQQHLLSGYYAIEADLQKQYGDVDSGYFRQSGNYIILTLTNNTSYTFTSTWDFTFLDKNSTKLKTESVIVSDIKPGETYEVKAYNSDSWDGVSYYNYYGAIK